VISKEISSGAKLIDESELTKQMTSDERSNIKGESMDGYDQAIERLGYDGMTRLEDTMEGTQYKSYYFPEKAKPPEVAKAKGKETTKSGFDYSNTQVNLPKESATAIKNFGKTIPDNELYEEGKDDDTHGREETPHITVRYGLETINPKDVEPAFKDISPIKVKFGKVSIFEPENENYDVVKVDVESQDLHEANKKVGETVELPGETYKDYKPHATIAYVKKGEGKKYVGDKSLEGKEVVIDSIYLSSKDGKMHEIKLKPAPAPEKTEVATEKAPEKPVQEVSEKESIGKAYINNQQKPIMSAREITRGKSKGKVEVTLTAGRDADGNIKAGKKVKVDRKAIIEWPDKVGTVLEPKKKATPKKKKTVTESAPNTEGITETIAQYSISVFSEEKEVDAPAISRAMLDGEPISSTAIKQWRWAAEAVGVSEENIEKGIRKFEAYNKIRKNGHWLTIPEMETNPVYVVIREGVLNTPAVEGERRKRLDRLYKYVKTGAKSLVTGKLFKGGSERTSIPKEARGLKPNVFLNVPITQAALSREKPSDLDYPLVVTGNPHIINFKRPHKSWDSSIKAVRIKPVMNGSKEANDAVVKAIEYANEIGAKVLITTFRAKQPWTLARLTNFITTDPKHADFNKYWKKNPNPKPADRKRMPDYVPYVPKGEFVKEVFRENGWETEKNIYGKGGTWWWPTSKELDPDILDRIDPETPVEYCDLLHHGCPSCRNCQKLTYPKSVGAPMLGVTDEPFCEHGCPQCFVRLGQSGVGGRKGISFEKNFKQQGYGEADIGDIFSETINIFQKIARTPVKNIGKIDYISKFLDLTPTNQLDMAMSLFMDNVISVDQLATIHNEIGNNLEHKPLYQIGKSIPIVGNESLLDLLRKSPPLKKATIGLSEDGSVWVRNKNGEGFNVKSVKMISPDKAALEIGHGRMLKSGEFIKGKYQNGVIELQRDMADEWTVSHENF
ncbi:MAG TPA: 2'-5' RNA ligase family protein, partial [Candidatus Bathyarchaeia archaeon]|nr:2'-5' RNA ligase family protein [Candidatus Bathyarchaeia archaeon]